MKYISIAIDGPSGAGKSTLARAISKKFNFMYVDTGAIYRTVALYALKQGIDYKDEAAVSAMLPNINIGLTYGEDGLQYMSLNGEDVTEEIRLPDVSQAASAVAAYPTVRAFLLETQRAFSKKNNVIMDGRDIGTVVLPNADIKIFLTASIEERAKRRTLELEQRGTPRPYAEILEKTRQRDYDDSHRSTAPLRQADDAILLDTTHFDFQESLSALERIIKEKIDIK